MLTLPSSRRHSRSRDATRFLIGFGLTFAASAAPLLVTEIAHPSQRGQATSLYNSLWSVLAPRLPSLVPSCTYRAR